MDRQIVYAGAIPLDTDQLQQNKNAMIGLGYALQALLGTGAVVDGLACTPTGPAGMTVNVANGSIMSLQNVDGTAYGSIIADTTHQIIKQGLVTSTTNLSCPAPGTTGQSINYLIQVAYQDVDGGATVLPYYNASNPATAYNGPNNTGVSQNTVRQGVCLVQVKAGVAATTGTQTTPAPDAGFTGLHTVTVANGQTTITSGSIAQLSTAPFISPKLPGVIPAVQAGAANYAVDTSVTPNTITVALSPAPSALTTGMSIRVKLANTVTSAAVLNLNSLGNVAVYDTNGNPIASGLKANNIYGFVYDGAHWELQTNPANMSTRESLTANRTYFVRTDGSDSNDGSANTSGNAFLTLQKAINTCLSIDLRGFSVTISVADGTYTGGVNVPRRFVGGNVSLQGNTTTPANCIISTTGADCISGDGAKLDVGGFKLTTTTSGNGISAKNNSNINIAGKMEFGAVASGYVHMRADGGSEITGSASYAISGGAAAHINANATSSIILGPPTVTLTGTPAFASAFVIASAGVIGFDPATTTFSGSATGKRYDAQANAVIQTQGAGASYFPGNASGTASTGGQYI